jgi:hypothetical protein
VTEHGIKIRRPQPSPLDVGDTFSYRVSMQVEFEDRTQAWVGMESGTTVRAGETAQDATDRLVEFIHGQLKHRIIQLNSDVQHFTD